ncbi:DUF6262 family protein [Hydrogenivirga sp. 128-5-R1-1]|uniref:DUF6262 family protein n=1 Tax=Hydrogenivirga sp. 128-5-R1-1 TaxID=392423 RepID=UPI00015F1984|nr:DUF6262 family protein [Hydrogenivirga sp. 128-5-R1-1]EDP73531.1 Tn554-related, transposase C [Hydrogenivirga sp. 128-5-R1-1]
MLEKKEKELENRKIIRNTRGIKEYAKKKKEETEKKVKDTIYRLVREKHPINFNTVAKEAGVSKAYLYKNKEIRKLIEEIRAKQGGLKSSKQMKVNMTEGNKDAIIAIKNKRIKELEEENRRLKEELERLRGILYEKI